MLASVGDRTLRVWTLDGTPVKTVKTEGDFVHSLSWKHDGSEIATGTRFDSILRINNLISDKDRATGRKTGGGPMAVAWNPDGGRIALGCWDHTIRLITADGRAGAVLSGRLGSVGSLAWNPSGDRLVSGGDAFLRIWNRQGIPMRAVKKHQKYIRSVAWSPDGSAIASVSEDSTARIWSAVGNVKTVIRLDQRARRVAWSPDSQQIVRHVGERRADLESRRQPRRGARQSTEEHGLSRLEPAAKPNRRRRLGPCLPIWNADGSVASSEKRPDAAVLSIDFSPDGSRAAMGVFREFRGQLALTEADGTKPQFLDAHAGLVHAVAWSPSGEKVVTGSYDNTLKFWDVKTAAPERVVLLFGNGSAATFTAAGQLEHGDISGLEADLVYVVETEDKPGEIQMLSPSDFEDLVSR